jgi:molybdopterin converting factor small subunit
VIQIKLANIAYLIHHDRIHLDEKEFTIPPGTKLNELIQMILSTYPNLRTNMDEIIISINKEFLKDKNPMLRNSDIIAIFPPVSGG